MKLVQGDCLEVLKTLPENSVDSLVTDPPAGISFMGKEWDGAKGGRKEWCAWMEGVMRECMRVMKPGAHGLVWALPRTSHWTATALEDAGFEIRDCIYHLFGSGFPKSMNVSIAIDKQAGAMGARGKGFNTAGQNVQLNQNRELRSDHPDYVPPSAITDAAKQWQGFGTALKPAVECWWLVRKPCSEKTIAANVLKWGTGALNIDASRIEAGKELAELNRPNKRPGAGASGFMTSQSREFTPAQGRFPSHLVLSHSPHCTDDQCDIECAIAMLDAQSGYLHGAGNKNVRKAGVGQKSDSITKAFGAENGPPTVIHDRGGHASRFFYCAKVSSSERNAGLEGMPDRKAGFSDGARRAIERGDDTYETETGGGVNRIKTTKNTHPTVKPQKLMRYLIRMVTPPNGTVLDPFMGSGSTGLAAKSEGFRFVGIEREQEYFEIAQARISSTLYVEGDLGSLL